MYQKKISQLTKSIAFSALFLICNPAIAKIPGEVALQVGGFLSAQGEDQFVNIISLIGDEFNVTKGHDGNALVGLGVYLDGIDNKDFSLLYGLNAYYFFNTKVTGTITQELAYTNLGYQYNITHLPIYAAVKAIIKTAGRQAYTFDFGVGPNIMRLSQYNDYSLDGIAQPDHAYTNHTQGRGSAMAGFGFRLNNAVGPVPLECGYRFFYLGEGQLTPTDNQIINTLKTGHIYANSIICSLII